MKATLEIACFSPEDAVVAARAGAHRIELCRYYDVGGLTPSVEDLEFVKERIDVPVFVMIRERAGDFVFFRDELERMKQEARELLASGADGLVFGALTKDRVVSEDALRDIVNLGTPTPVTFHRAFDLVADPLVALDVLKSCGVARVLTSGGKSVAMEGEKLLARLVQQGGDDLIVVPGGGVRSHNVDELINRTGAREIHSAARTTQAKVDPQEVGNLVKAIA